jgi:septal ring factor EnvC (AmiA/AmiB activator)
VNDDDANERIVADLHARLQESQQQQRRLKDVLTRVLKLIDDGERA